MRRFLRRNRVASAVLLGTALGTLAACGLTQNRIVPLLGEDEAAVRLSGERAVWLERTGSTRAVEALREALIRGDAAGALAYVGPRTRERLQAARGGLPGEEALLAPAGRRSLPAEVARGIEVLAAEGPFQVREADPWDPSRRQVRVRVSSSKGEILLSAFFVEEGGWRIECLPEEAGPRVPDPGTLPGDPG
jgi:hypothetical protein